MNSSLRQRFVKRSVSVGTDTLVALILLGLLGGWAGRPAARAPQEPPDGKAQRPNVVVILADDLGYGDVSYNPHHPPEVRTPHIDSLAASGVRFPNGYVSGDVCAPTRAGLLTGRYQQRFGFYQSGDAGAGLPASEITIAEVLGDAGYATGAFGKWHVGAGPPSRPLAQGFEAFYGFLGHGAHDYWDLAPERGQFYNAIRRGDEMVDDTGRGYLTDILAEESVSFIREHRREPFFLYLPFNAVHEPKQAREKDRALFDTGDGSRDVLMGMLRRLDLAIGAVIGALKEEGLYENTLVFFLSDNGGPIRMHASNAPLRGHKHTFLEGGVRVPFLISWPGALEPGTVDHPVIALDVLPTAAAAAGAELPEGRTYDGRNLLPLMRGEADAAPHEHLVFDDHTDEWAIRGECWKLYSDEQGSRTLWPGQDQRNFHLFNLCSDIAEENDALAQHPEVVERLKSAFQAWKKEMAPPLTAPKDEISR